MATLEEMQFNVGQLMQLQFQRLDQARLYVKLIGYLVNQAVIVTMPTLGDQPFQIREGDAFICRAFAGRLAFGFEAHAIKLSPLPFPHLYLSYPQKVESVVVRKSARLATQREATLLKSSEQGEARESATIVDISASGTRVIAKADFAKVKDSLVLVLPAIKPEEGEIRLPVIVRSARVGDNGAANASTCQYGMEFVNLGSQETRAVEKLIQEQLTRGL